MPEPDLKTQIKAELDLAHQLDSEAQAHRRRAGKYLEQVYGNHSHIFNDILRDLGMNRRLAELLIEISQTVTEPRARSGPSHVSLP